MIGTVVDVKVGIVYGVDVCITDCIIALFFVISVILKISKMPRKHSKNQIFHNGV